MVAPSGILARIDGPLVILGYGSIGRGVLPLIERHIDFDRDNCTVLSATDQHAAQLVAHGVKHLCQPLTPENHETVLRGLFPQGGGMLVNLSVDVESLALMRLCHQMGTLYIDTVIEPWPGLYFGSHLPNVQRTNYRLREGFRALGRELGPGPTAVTCCGANQGMISWLLKEALLILAKDLGRPAAPQSQADWARLAMDLGVKGLHVAERDTQVSARPKPLGTFVNTWSVDGFLSEAYQPAEIGWGTHEKTLPPRGHRFDFGPRSAIWIDRPGCETRVRSWVPEIGGQFGLVVTHAEALSISDFYTVRDGDTAIYRPTCHYAYHPCNDAILSIQETSGAGILPRARHILDPAEIVSGRDDLGVLLYGHARGAMWYGSRLSIEETRALAPEQNATGLQVTSAVLAGMVWALENPRMGLVEPDQMDHARCLAIQRPYLGRVEAHYTDWTPLAHRINHFAETVDRSDPWQFTNFLVD